MNKNMKKSNGFTLAELMVVIAIIAVVAAVGFPGIQDLSASSKLSTSANSLLASFHRARSEALRGATNVQITAVGGDWADGWTVTYTNSDGPHTVTSDRLANGITVTADPVGAEPFATSYRYNLQGRLQTAGGVNINTNQILFCDSRPDEFGRRLTLRPIGNITVEIVENEEVCN